MTSTSSSKKKSFQISCNIVVLEEEEKAPHNLIIYGNQSNESMGPNETIYGNSLSRSYKANNYIV